MKKFTNFVVYLTLTIGTLLFAFNIDKSTQSRIPGNKLSTEQQSITLDVSSIDFGKEKLVPKGRAIFKGQTDVITLTYYIDVELFNDGTYHLCTEIINITIGEVDTYNHLLEFTVLNGNKLIEENKVEVIVEIRLNEPEDHVQYLGVAGKMINFQIKFEVR